MGNVKSVEIGWHLRGFDIHDYYDEDGFDESVLNRYDVVEKDEQAEREATSARAGLTIYDPSLAIETHTHRPRGVAFVSWCELPPGEIPTKPPKAAAFVKNWISGLQPQTNIEWGTIHTER